jgi:nucleotide-binding universal stress UspA family protein
MKILLAADGSEFTKRAARQLARHIRWFAEMPEVHVLHVHPPVPYPGAAARAGKSALEKYLREDSEEALAPAKKELTKAGVAFEATWCTGDVVREIAAFVKKHDIDLIVMGSHGEGALSNLVLGSVTTKVLATVKTPLLIVR